MSQQSRIHAAILARISSDKQFEEGDSIRQQIDICLHYANKNGWVVNPTNIFQYVYSSAKKDVHYLDEVIKKLKSQKNVTILIVKDITRFSRHGFDKYMDLKERLSDVGISLKDTRGVIGEEINTLEHLGVEYSWSKINPHEESEIAEASNAKRERQNILNRMIGAEIGYRRLGYAVRQAPYGLRNIKIHTEHGIRTIREVEPDEFKVVQTAFNLKADTTLTDNEIADLLNSMGHKNRDKMRWRRDDGNKRVPVTKIGGGKITGKQVRRFVENFEYAGVICEKWTENKPINAKNERFITIDLFNKANRGKIQLTEERDGRLSVNYNVRAHIRIKNNPEYPYKGFVLCPECHKPLLASSPKGKSGKRFPTYHCSRNHKYFGLSSSKVDGLVENILESMTFDKSTISLFREVVKEVWSERNKESQIEIDDQSKKVKDIQDELNGWVNKLGMATSEVVFKQIEKRIEDTTSRLAEAQSVRNQKEVKQLDINNALNFCCKLMEHPLEAVKNELNLTKKTQVLSLLFEEKPCVRDLVNGTPKIDAIFNLKQLETAEKVSIVTPRVVVRNQVIPELIQFYRLFATQIAKLNYQPAYYSV